MDFEKYLDDSYEVITGEGLYKINGGAEKDGVSGAGTPEYYTRHGGAPVSPTSNTESGGSATSKRDGGDKGCGNTSTTSTTTNNNQQGTPQNYNGPKEEEKTRRCGYVLDEEGAFGNGHAGFFVQRGKIYTFFELNQIPITKKELDKLDELSSKPETTFLSSNDLVFPPAKLMRILRKTSTAGIIQRDFNSKEAMWEYLKIAGKNNGYDSIVEFKVTEKQSDFLFNIAIKEGKSFFGYHFTRKSCGIWARDMLTKEETGINSMDVVKFVTESNSVGTVDSDNFLPLVFKYSSIPNSINDVLKYANPDCVEYRIPK